MVPLDVTVDNIGMRMSLIISEIFLMACGLLRASLIVFLRWVGCEPLGPEPHDEALEELASFPCGERWNGSMVHSTLKGRPLVPQEILLDLAAGRCGSVTSVSFPGDHRSN